MRFSKILFITAFLFFTIQIVIPQFAIKHVIAGEDCGVTGRDPCPDDPPPESDCPPNCPPINQPCTGGPLVCAGNDERGGGGQNSGPGAVHYCYRENPPQDISVMHVCEGAMPPPWILSSWTGSTCFKGAQTCSPVDDPCLLSDFLTGSTGGRCTGESLEVIQVIGDCDTCPSYPNQPCWGCERVFDYWDCDDEGFHCRDYYSRRSGVN